MQPIDIKIQLINKNSVLPKRSTDGSAGYDLTANVENTVTINPGDLVKIPTGIAISLPSNEYGAFIFARSGLGVKHGITLSNCVGVIDSDYTGEIIVGLCNVSDKSYTINPADRIAQMCILPVFCANFEICESLEKTHRGSNGFGSTGK